MNIIFGDAIKQIPSDFVVLELDTIIMEPMKYKLTTWCVISDEGVTSKETSNRHKKIHNDLMIEYRNQNWSECLKLINELLGSWNGEVDTFYQELQKRVENFKNSPPDPGWDGAIVKQITFS